MRKKFIIPVILCVAVLCATAVVMSEAEKNKTKDDWYRQVELFSDAMALIRADYVTDVNPKDLIYGALRGMLSSLDPHSQFMDPETYGELRVDTEGKFGGLGIEITLKDGLLTVVTPIEDTPAWKAGLKANDRIVKIDDDLTRDMSLTDAVKKLRGKPGAAVTLTILRESESKILEFKMVRDIIKIKDIKLAKILEDGIGYIRLVEFRENTSADMEAVLKRLKSEGMRALVLDLRNNPGGLLDVAVNVAERFIQKGKMIVYTQGRRGSQDFKFVSRAANPILDLPMVILVNEGSASGSEIVAGCLQDHKRAIILGTKSFGKGSVQTVIPLSDGSALRLTTSKYFTPSGRQIHGKGVIPDIVVENARVEPLDMTALKNDKSKEVFDGLENKDSKQAKAQPAEYDYHLDNQLMHAIDVLKAIVIYKPA
jgi:carboxyl-terminal processing protease